MTDRQRQVLDSMKKGVWYTARSLGTNEICMNGLRTLQLVKRRQGPNFKSGGSTLNVRWEYTKA